MGFTVIIANTDHIIINLIKSEIYINFTGMMSHKPNQDFKQ